MINILKIWTVVTILLISACGNQTESNSGIQTGIELWNGANYGMTEELLIENFSSSELVKDLTEDSTCVTTYNSSDCFEYNIKNFNINEKLTFDVNFQFFENTLERVILIYKPDKLKEKTSYNLSQDSATPDEFAKYLQTLTSLKSQLVSQYGEPSETRETLVEQVTVWKPSQDLVITLAENEKLATIYLGYETVEGKNKIQAIRKNSQQ